MYFKELKEKYNWKNFKINILNKGFFHDLRKNFDEITSLSKEERSFLKNNYKISTIELINLLSDKESETYKGLFKLEDGNRIEAVLMRYKDGRNSVCVSTQVGCPVGCIFCATGKLGFKRNLTRNEIVDQVLFFARFLKYELKVLTENPITNIVYMGMGEPMLNLKNVIESIKILTNKDEFGISPRRITVSSSGYINQLKQLLKEDLKIRLAISLHAPNQTLREKLMPVAKIYSLNELFKFLNSWEKETNKRVSYEYTLIKGVNDTIKNADELVELLNNRLAHVNLIPYNPIGNQDNFSKPEKSTIYKFAQVLKDNNIPVTIRITKGDKIQAACGQLAGIVNNDDSKGKNKISNL